MANIEMTVEEIKATRAMLDIALKTVGRQIIPTFMQIDTKFGKAELEAAAETPEVPTLPQPGVPKDK